MVSFSRAGQFALMHRLAASPSSRTILPPQMGQCAGMRNFLRAAPCFSTRTTFGITSPERSITTSSPISRPKRSISSSLCNVARATVTPLTSTGFRCATGVSAPVRPTCTSIDSTVVTACRAAYLYAMAQRGAFDVKPKRALLRDGIHLHHYAIDFVSQLFAPLAPVVAERKTSSISAHRFRSGFTLNPMCASDSSDSQWVS